MFDRVGVGFLLKTVKLILGKFCSVISQIALKKRDVI